MLDPSVLSLPEILRLQDQLQQELTRRFQRPMALLFTDIVGSTAYFGRFGDVAGRQLQQLPPHGFYGAISEDDLRYDTFASMATRNTGVRP